MGKLAPFESQLVTDFFRESKLSLAVKTRDNWMSWGLVQLPKACWKASRYSGVAGPLNPQ